MRFKMRHKHDEPPAAVAHDAPAAGEPVVVVGGVRVEPYELPDDPMGNAQQLAYMKQSEEARLAAHATLPSRSRLAVAEGLRKSRGPGWDRLYFHRWAVSFHRKASFGGTRWRLGLSRVGLAKRRWELNIDFWTGR